MNQKNNEVSIDFMTDRQHLLKLGGVLLVGLVVGVLISGVYFDSKLKKAKSEYDQQLAKAKEQSLAGGAPALPEISAPDEIFGISGTIKKIEGNILTVEAFFFGEQKTYKITAGSDTKIIKREMLENPPQPTEEEPFNPFKETELGFSDIKQGDSISVETLENIKDKTEFTAKQITIIIMPVAPIAPEPTAAPEAPAPQTAP